MSKQAIGVFDSGLGGLTAVKELRRLMPNEDIVYFGDTARVPYGTRGRKTIIEYAVQDMAFLLTKSVKFLVAACGTVSSVLPPEVERSLPVPYRGVVDAAAKAAANATRTGRVGVLATEATIASGSYKKALLAINKNLICQEVACPLFVPLVENGHFAKGDPLAALAAKMYLAPLVGGVDTLILGCTHYPLMADVIENQVGNNISLVNPGAEVAKQVQAILSHTNALHGGKRQGKMEFFVSDDEERFGRLGTLFLGESMGKVTRVNIEKKHLGM